MEDLILRQAGNLPGIRPGCDWGLVQLQPDDVPGIGLSCSCGYAIGVLSHIVRSKSARIVCQDCGAVILTGEEVKMDDEPIDRLTRLVTAFRDWGHMVKVMEGGYLPSLYPLGPGFRPDRDEEEPEDRQERYKDNWRRHELAEQCERDGFEVYYAGKDRLTPEQHELYYGCGCSPKTVIGNE
jgi:hypothetical protein